jgi:hypothetical protein
METQQTIYCGSGKAKDGKFGEFFSISICLSDLPKEHISEAKNGKKYINLNINRKKEPDQYGKDLSVQVDTWKPTPQGNLPQAMAHSQKPQYVAPQDEESTELPF